ncbi:MAG: hypothetical protein ABIJ59_19395 [Pseudomonadota bacterium]
MNSIIILFLIVISVAELLILLKIQRLSKMIGGNPPSFVFSILFNFLGYVRDQSKHEKGKVLKPWVTIAYILYGAFLFTLAAYAYLYWS